MKKRAIEILLVGAQLTGVPEKRLLKSRNVGAVDLVWPRTGVARKSAAREMVFKKGKVDFAGEEWTKRVLFREEIEGRCGLAVTVTEPVVSAAFSPRFQDTVLVASSYAPSLLEETYSVPAGSASEMDTLAWAPVLFSQLMV